MGGLKRGSWNPLTNYAVKKLGGNILFFIAGNAKLHLIN